MAFPALAAWMTGTDTQRTLRMALGSSMGRPSATFAGGVNPTTSGGSHGVVGGGDLLVSVSSGLQMTVTAGGCFINGSSALAQGCYYGYNDAAYAGANVLLAAHSASPRVDLIVARANDNAEDGLGSTAFSLNKIQGTPGAGTPAVPAGCLVLASCAVPATSGAVVVTDTRPFAAGLGGYIRCLSTQRPTAAALWQGQVIYETNTNRTWRYSGSAWVPMMGHFVCVLFSTQIVTSGATTACTFSENEDTDAYFTSGTTMTVPATLAGTYHVFAYVDAATVASALGLVMIKVNGATVAHQEIVAGTTGRMSFGRSINLAVGDTVGATILNGHSASVTFTVVLSAYRLGD